MKYLKIWNAINSRPLSRDIITTTIFSTFGKGIGFLIPFFIAAWFGVSEKTDAFFFAYGLIIFLAMTFSPVVESIVVPFIANAIARGEDIGSFIGKLIGIGTTWLSAFLLILIIIIKPILVMVTRFPAEGIELIYIIILESAPLLILLFWNSVIAGVFNSYKYFYIPALSPALRAIINLSLIFYLKDKFGIHAVSIGYVFGELFRVIVLFKLLNKFCLFNLKISISWDIKLRGFLRVSFYQFAGMTAVAFTPIINKSMASWIGPSSVSLLEYSNRLYIIPLVFMSSGLVVPLLSHWSERYQQGGKEGLDKDVIKAVKVIGIFSIFLSLFLFIFRTNIVNIIYGYGRLSINQIDSIAGIWGLQVLGLAPNILSHVYSRTHLIKMNTRFILYSSLLIVVAGFLLNIALIPSMGVRGIALSSTLVAFLYLFLMSYFYYYRQ